jgi:hypothetical protein
MAGRHGTSRPADGYDTGWKGILEPYLKLFFALVMGSMHDQIDWDRGYVFCDGELRKGVKHNRKGLKCVDRLVKVWLLSGTQQYLYIHIEFQAQRDPSFARRMWVYFVLLDVQHDGHVSSIAILGDNNPDWRPDSYSFERWGNTGMLKYPVIKLKDYADRIEELMASENIFGVVIAAYLKAIATRRNMGSRKQWKTAILRALLEQGRTEEEIRDVFRFIDLVMPLPETLREEFDQDVREMEKEKGMPFLSYIEQDAMKRGRQEGRQEGRQGDILEALALRFQNVPGEVRTAVQAEKDTRRLKSLHRQAILCGSMEEFQRTLKVHASRARARVAEAVTAS